MGRKKKIKKEEVKQEETVVQGAQTINYQGSISLSINKGKKVLLKKKYHNKGMPNLFKFLANCLAGNYSGNLRPNKIKLFYNPDTSTSPSNWDWNTAWGDNTTKPKAVSPYILFDATPVVETKENACQVTLHFRVPFSYISGDKINIVALYQSDASDDQSQVAAYYLLTDENNTWDGGIDLSEVSTNYSLIIEWTLIVANKTAN